MITFRKASQDDVPMLRHWDRMPHVKVASGEADCYDWEVEISTQADWQEIYIACLKGVPIGVVIILDPVRDISHYWGDVGANIRAIDIWLGELNVMGRGYGSKIMKMAIGLCFSDGDVDTILIDPLESNIKAHRFYERLGFKYLRKQQFGQDTCFVYQLKLSDWRE